MSSKVLHALDMQYYNLSSHVAQLTVLDCDRSSSVIPENNMAFLQMKIGL